jgi:hypothetical protein
MQLTPRLPDHLACVRIDIVETFGPAMARDDKALHVVTIDVGGDLEPFGQ